MENAEWHGVMPALMTEMHSDGSLDLEATAVHAEKCISAGVEGIIALGTLGENCSLTPKEKSQVGRAIVEAVDGRVPVICGVAEYTCDFAIERVRMAEKIGMDGLMTLPGMVYKQDSREAITHFGNIAESTDLPIMVYNNHVGYKVDLLPRDFLELAKYDNIVAVKESSHDSRRLTDMINECGNRFMLFSGVDDLALENVLFGAIGWVSGITNSFPHETVRLFNLAKSGKVDEAVALYRWLMPMLHLDTEVKLVQYIKLVSQIAGMGSEWVRQPRLPLEGTERARIEEIVQDALDCRPALAA
ncbi:MAG: dihydrodipicolinate synthase/N-acetylneuraminate lyase [Pirellulaceae bacterium]|jgi:dihydrodipicolinate synthase/N-acetylneuraminate lyase